MKLSKTWTTVTPLSKFLALFFFIFFIILGFHLGRFYQRSEAIRYMLRSQKAEVIESRKTSDDMSDWEMYKDATSKISFRYPSSWRTAETSEGNMATIIHTDSSLYRGIEFTFKKGATQNLQEHALSSLKNTYNNEVISNLSIEPILINKIEAVEVTNFPSGVHTQVVFSFNDYIVTGTLIEGGEIGGGSAYTFSTAPEDKQTFYLIIATFQLMNEDAVQGAQL